MEIGVIGGGPGGMMAAYFAAQAGASVTLLERNEKLGKKIYISGKGQCNLTNACDEEDFLDQVVSNPYFLYSSIYSFSPRATMAFFEGLGLDLVVERGRRVFPKSKKASDVTRALEGGLRDLGVRIELNSRVKEIKKEKKFMLKVGKTWHKYDKIILATGGVTYPATGSSGDGYGFARSLGHKIKEPRPGLVGLDCGLRGLKDLQGLTLKNVALKATGPISREIFGDLVFTHFGVSGPIVLSMSSHINRLEGVDLSIDLKPALDRAKLDRRILRLVDSMKNKEAKTLLQDLLPRSLVPLVLDLAGIEEDKRGHQLSREDREDLISVLKSLPLDYKRTHDLATGIVTSGGVLTQEVDPSSLESKLVPGLYLAGEVLDLDALTGGYNMQIAFATGALAGRSSAGD